MGLDLVEPQRLDDTERVALAVEGLGLQRLIHAAERHHAGLGAERAEEIGGQLAARGADLEPGEIIGVADRPVTGGDVVEAVEPAIAKGMQARLSQLAPDHLAERTVECGEHRGVVLESEGQQWQGTRWRDAAQGRPGEKEFEPARLQIGEHLRVGAEPAFREDVEAELAVGVAADRLGHLGEAARRRAVRRLVDPEAIMKARIWHGPMIIGCAGRAKLLILRSA